MHGVDTCDTPLRHWAVRCVPTHSHNQKRTTIEHRPTQSPGKHSRVVRSFQAGQPGSKAWRPGGWAARGARQGGSQAGSLVRRPRIQGEWRASKVRHSDGQKQGLLFNARTPNRVKLPPSQVEYRVRSLQLEFPGRDAVSRSREVYLRLRDEGCSHVAGAATRSTDVLDVLVQSFCCSARVNDHVEHTTPHDLQACHILQKTGEEINEHSDMNVPQSHFEQSQNCI